MFAVYEGRVEDRNDPLKLGRVRVRVIGLHTADKTLIPTDSLPWALVAQPTTDAAMSGIGNSPTGIVNGTTVLLYFRDLETKQQPVVFATLGGIPNAPANAAKGFNDPEGIYPKGNRIGEPDTNRLARGVTSGTSIETQNTNLDSIEPPSPYNATYPYNKVYESEKGLVIEVDDSGIAPRVRMWHPAGTYEEIHPNGTRVVRSGKNDVIVTDANRNLHVRGNYNIIVDGNANVTIKGDSATLVEGNADITVKGDATTLVEGNEDRTINGDVNEVINGNVTRTIIGTKTETNTGNVTTINAGTVTETTAGQKSDICAGPFILQGNPLTF